MALQLTKTDYILWSVILAYTGIIYATVSIISAIRKNLTERFGYGVYDFVYWIFGAIGLGFLVYVLRKFKGKDLVSGSISLTFTVLLYWYFLTSLDRPIEKIHFLQYGLLGALVYAALIRHMSQALAFPFGCLVVYCLGLGDEAIQWALPSRVGEIADCMLNLLSGFLGIGAMHLCVYSHRQSRTPTIAQAKALVAALAATTVFTGLFLSYVHGFGHVLESAETGRIYSTFSHSQLRRINSKDAPALSKTDRRIFENEGLRHLHQREFYLTNDFLIKGGGYYRQLDKAFLENQILEKHYSRYLEENATNMSSEMLQRYDPDVAQKSGHTVMWPDSVKTWLESVAPTYKGIYTSRVKSTMITTFDIKDMLVYIALVLAGLAYVFFLLHKAERRRKRE